VVKNTVNCIQYFLTLVSSTFTCCILRSLVCIFICFDFIVVIFLVCIVVICVVCIVLSCIV